MTNLTQEYLRKRLHYDPDTGMFTWKQRDVQPDNTMGDRLFNTKFSGKRAGHVWTYKKSRTKYRSIHLAGKMYQEHRLAFLYMTGKFPPKGVDHKDGDGLNNRWGNLRPANQSENKANGRLNSNNTTGFKGVTFYKATQRFQAQIYVRGKNIALGYFNTSEKAAIAYKKAALIYFGEFARG